MVATKFKERVVVRIVHGNVWDKMMFELVI